MSTAAGEWEKALWKKQPYPDNYVPESFLSSLRRNTNFRPYAYWPLVLAAFSITQHLSAISIFLVTFVRILDGSWDPRVLVWVSIGVFLLGYITWEALGYSKADVRSRPVDRSKALKSSLLVFLALLGLSPVLRTLTAATSSDSIWALTTCLFIANVLLADYGSSRPQGLTRERLTSVLSMNAAVSASVVLASRLQDDLSVFALVLFSVQLFALFPFLRSRLQVTPPVLRGFVTMLLVAISTHLSASVSGIMTSLFCSAFLFITFGAPAVLVWAQKYKNEIRGPWDVAVPQLR